MNNFSDSNPGLIRAAFCWLRTKRPAPINATSASAVSTTTSKLRIGLLRQPTELPRPPAFKVSARSGDDAFQSGSGAKERAGHERDAEREEQDVRIEREVDIVAIDERGAIRPENVASPVGDHQSDAAPASESKRALGEQLAQDSSAARAERGAHGHLFVARRGLREQKVGEIGACDQQHEADGAHHHRARKGELIVLVDADGGFGKRRQRDARPALSFGYSVSSRDAIVFSDASACGIYDARFQPAERRSSTRKRRS